MKHTLLLMSGRIHFRCVCMVDCVLIETWAHILTNFSLSRYFSFSRLFCGRVTLCLGIVAYVIVSMYRLGLRPKPTGFDVVIRRVPQLAPDSLRYWRLGSGSRDLAEGLPCFSRVLSWVF